MSKPRSDSKLLNLPEADQERIVAWLTEGVDGDTSYKTVAEQIYLDFNCKVSTSALGVFWNKVVAPRKLRASSAAASDLAKVARGSGVVFEDAALAACQQKAFEILASPDPDPKAVLSFFGLVLDAQKIALKKEDLTLQREKFRAAISKKIDLGLEELYAEIKNSPEALDLFNRIKDLVRKGVEEA